MLDNFVHRAVIKVSFVRVILALLVLLGDFKNTGTTDMSAYENIVNECQHAARITIRSEVYTNELYSAYIFKLILNTGTVYRHMYFGCYTKCPIDLVDFSKRRVKAYAIVHDALSSVGFNFDEVVSEAFSKGDLAEISVGRKNNVINQ